MSETMLIRHCSPTLAGLKTGSMFTCSFENVGELRSGIRTINRRLASKGLRVLPLRIGDSTALIYVYRPSRLKTDLETHEAARILESLGYIGNTPGHFLIELIARLKNNEGFPHEVGLFLGYPPEDVSGFIKNKAKDSKCVGTWKVYGDEEKAKRLFDKYKKCTAVYIDKYNEGHPLERLTVADQQFI